MNNNKLNNTQTGNKLKKLIYGLEFLLLISLVVAVPIYLGFFRRDLLVRFSSVSEVMSFLSAYKSQSVFIYIGIQILQIVISIIPGQAFQMAAGYLYGFFPGLLYSIIGATLGTSLTYGIAKLLGRQAVNGLFGEEKIQNLLYRLNTKRAYTIIFLIYLIPGVPKDLLGYAAGISQVKFWPFLLLSTVGRSFGMSGSLLFGVLFAKKLYIIMGILAFVAVAIFALCLYYRNKVDAFFDMLYIKMSK